MTTAKPTVAVRLTAWLARIVQSASRLPWAKGLHRASSVGKSLFTDKQKRVRIILPLGLILVALIISLLMISPSKPKTGLTAPPSLAAPRTRRDTFPPVALTARLNAMGATLAKMQATLSSQGAVIDVDKLRTTIAALSDKMRTLSAESQTLLHREIQKATAPIAQQLRLISAKLSKLEAERHKTTLVSASHLPFKVLQIDNIQQTNVVTLTYNHQIFPVDVGDSVAGWRLRAADFAAQTAEFVNQKHERVRLALNRLGGKQ